MRYKTWRYQTFSASSLSDLGAANARESDLALVCTMPCVSVPGGPLRPKRGRYLGHRSLTALGGRSDASGGSRTRRVAPRHASLRLCTRRQLYASVTKAHSPSTLSSPRSRNCRMPIACFTISNTGSTVCLRNRYCARCSGRGPSVREREQPPNSGLVSTARCCGHRRHRQTVSVRVCSPASRRVAPPLGGRVKSGH